MAEGTAEGPHIEIASNHDSFADLKRKAAESAPKTSPAAESPHEKSVPEPQRAEGDASAIEEILRRRRERGESLQEVPLYFGAVFEGGKNEVHVTRHDLIATLNVNDENDRTRFIFRNLHAFNYRFGKGSAWKGAVEDWIKDFVVANEGAQIDSEAEKRFLEKIKAMMAVTASARAMEDSAGTPKTYLVNLVGANERGDPKTDEQDLSSSFLLHADPGKLNLVINDALVRPYYDRLMQDAYVDRGPGSEWVGQTPSKLNLKSGLEVGKVRENSALLSYVSNETKRDDAKNVKGGGLPGYIEEVLLPKVQDSALEGVEDRVKKAAARLACDAFLVDKWTRWVDLVTEQGATERDINTALKLQPTEQWGGDPLNAVLRPSGLPRLKKVYSGPDSVILDLVDSTFRPTDIYNYLSKEYQKGYHQELPTSVRLLVPSAITNLKTYWRYNSALDKFLGGPMATGIPAWTPDILNKDLTEIANLIEQVYGIQEINVPGDRPGETTRFTVGHHIAGAVMMRLLYTKALAATLESSKPNWSDKMEIILDPKNRDRPFLDVRTTLFGSKLNGSSGFIRETVSERLDLVVWENMFDAEKYYINLRNLLETNDQGGGAYANTLHTLGIIANSLSAIGKSAGYVKK